MYDLETRLYVELVPDQNGREELITVVEALKPLVKGRFIDPNKWHITIMHFGIASHVYTELLQVLPNLAQSTFLKALESYIHTSKQTLPPPIKLKLVGYELLGGRNNVLAVRLELTNEIKQAHLQALSNLKQFFSDVGLEQPEDFMRRSHNFSWALTIKPHLTIARGINEVELEQLPPSQADIFFECADIHGL
jgi:2'-5' RNA ligase